MSVGVRKLKNNLSAYLKRVRRGETVRVTDRGEVIAEIKSPGAKATLDAVLDDLIAEGSVTLGTGSMKDFKPVTLKPSGTLASEMLIGDRG